MVAGLTYNPFALSNAQNTLNVESKGYIVGVAMDDPSVRNQLTGGVLANTETLPMWGGVGIAEFVPGQTAGPLTSLGPLIGRATALTGAFALKGFSVYNQAHHMFSSPSSQAPLCVPGQSMHYYRLGSRARIPLACAASLASVRGQPTSNEVSWDYVNQVLVPAQAAYAANTVTAATWAATNGGQATYTTTSPHGVAVGQPITIAGMTPAGYNGTFTTAAGTTGSTIVVALPTNPGAATAFGALAAGGGVLPVTLLDIEVANCIGPAYAAASGLCTWNYQASAALVEI